MCPPPKDEPSSTGRAAHSSRITSCGMPTFRSGLHSKRYSMAPRRTSARPSVPAVASDSCSTSTGRSRTGSHPRDDYMEDVFGLPYTQVETYYVMKTTPGAKVFLDLKGGADVGLFEADARAALDGMAFDPERHLQAHEARQHQLYLIPAGTPHASGAGNVVLEISATPYLYTLRFYDWLRRNLDGRMRPVHLEHAFANLDPRPRTDLVQEPRKLRAGDGWR